MAFGWLTKETRSAYIVRPPEAAQLLVYLHPDKSIPRGTKLTVRNDECALFFREGRYIGRIDAGSVLLDTANVPFLGHLLVDNLTDANHFICEVFFVSLNEIIFSIGQTAIGQYRDRNSANVVAISGSVSYTVKVSDPARLVTELGGQSEFSGAKVEHVLNGRMLNHIRRAVGMRVQANPVLDVVSNTESEAVSDEVRKLGQAEFSTLGIGVARVFNLDLALDAESLQILRAFGKQESELALQAKGMQLATGDGFAEFNMVQGQRAALEGLGKGLGTGNSAMLMSGFNIGANLTGAGSRPPARAPAAARQSTILASQASFILKGNGVADTGPYSARQIALMAISRGLALADLQIRGTNDSDNVVFSADLEPQILAEYKRRAPVQAPHKAQTSASPTGAGASGVTSAANPGAQAFAFAFSAASKNGQISLQDVQTLSGLALSLGLDADLIAAQARVSELINVNAIKIVT